VLPPRERNKTIVDGVIVRLLWVTFFGVTAGSILFIQSSFGAELETFLEFAETGVRHYFHVMELNSFALMLT
jgi:hypothetical protein